MATNDYLQARLKSKQNSERTVYNPLNSIYKRLTKFFSGPIVKYKVPTMINPDGRFNNRERVNPDPVAPLKRRDEYIDFNQMTNEKALQVLRIERNVDFQAMDFVPEINTALDIYAGDIASYTEFSEILKIVTPNDEIKEQLRTLFYDTLNIEMNLFGWTRATCKNGDHFLFLDLDDKLGITRAVSLPVLEIERLENEDPSNPNYVKFQWNKEGITFENFSIAHFRILGDDKFYPYGTSILEGARRIFRQLNLIEDNMMAYRIVRAPERRVFKLDVSGIEPDKREAAVEKAINSLKREPIIDPATGRVNLRYGAASVENDIYLPVTKGSETTVDVLQGGQNVGDVDDVKYLRDKLFSALKIPASYLSSEGSAEDRTSLAQKDIVFARTVLRIQNSILAELTKIAMIHLLILGYSGNDLLNFKLKLNNPSRIAEMQELEQLKSRTAVAQSLSESYFSKNYIWKKVFSLNDEEIERMRTEIKGDSAFNAYLASLESSAMGAGVGAGSGGGGGGLGDLGISDEDMNALGGIESGQPPQDSNLLVTPENDGGGGEAPPMEQGRRMDDAYLTPGARGKYYSKVQPGMDGRLSAGRARQMKATGGSTMTQFRDLFPGFKSMDSFARGIFPESKQDADESVLLDAQQYVEDTIQVIQEKRELINTRLSKYFQRK